MGTSRLGKVDNSSSSTVGQRLFSPGPHSEFGALGKIKYSEAAVLSRVLEAQQRSDNTELSWSVVERTQLSSVSPKLHGLPQMPKELEQDAVGGWSPGQLQGYVRTARKRISIMQSHVAELLRQGKGELLGEMDLEKDISERLLQLGFAEDVVREQAKRLSRAREPSAAANRKRNPSPAAEHQEDTGGSVGHMDSGDEDGMLEQREDEVQTW